MSVFERILREAATRNARDSVDEAAAEFLESAVETTKKRTKVLESFISIGLVLGEEERIQNDQSYRIAVTAASSAHAGMGMVAQNLDLALDALRGDLHPDDLDRLEATLKEGFHVGGEAPEGNPRASMDSAIAYRVKGRKAGE